MVISFTIPGNPVAQGRPRASIQRGKIHMRDPDKSRAYKQHVALVARQNAPKKPIEAPVSVIIRIHRPIPASMTKKLREAVKQGIHRPIVKPDCSNIAKGIEDAMNGIIYKDDSQIVDLTINKYYSDNPRVEVEIETVEG